MSLKMKRVMCFIVTALLILLQITCENEIEKEFLCGDENCSEPIGKFKVILDYNANSAAKISAKKTSEGEILAKSTSAAISVVKVKIKDEIGFIPKHTIREINKPKKNLVSVKLRVPAEFEKNRTHKNDKEEANKTVFNSNESDMSGDIAQVSDVIPEDQRNDSRHITDQTSAISPESPTNVTDDLSQENSNKVDTEQNIDKPSSTPTLAPPTENSEVDTKDKTFEEEKNEKIYDEKSTEVDSNSVQNNESVTEVSSTNYQKNESALDHDTIEQNVQNETNIENITSGINETIHQEEIERLKNSSDPNQNANVASHLAEESNKTINDEKIQNNLQLPSEPNSSAVDNTEQLDSFNAESISKPVTQEASNHDNLTEKAESNSNASLEANVTSHFDNLTEKEEINSTASLEANVTSNFGTLTEKEEINSNVLLETNLVVENGSLSDIKNPTTGDQNQSPTESTAYNNDSINAQANITVTDLSMKAVNDSVSSETTPTKVESKTEVPSRSKFHFPNAHQQATINQFENNQSSYSDSKTSDSLLPDENVTNISVDSTADSTSESSQSSPQADSVESSTTPVIPKIKPEIPTPGGLFETTTELTADTTQKTIFSDIQNENPIPPNPLLKTSKDEKSPLMPISSATYESLPSDNVTPSESEKTDSLVSSSEVESGTITVSKDPSISAEEKLGLDDFIHVSRKQSSSSDDDLQEKSILDTVQEYLPDLSGFQISDMIPVESIETIKNLFDFGLFSQKQEESEFCSTEEFCGSDRLNSFMDNQLHKSKKVELPLWGELSVENKERLIWISGIVSASILTLILLLSAVNYVKKKSRTTMMISRINQLENKLLVATKEIVTLQDQLKDVDSQRDEKQNAVEAERIAEAYKYKIKQYKERIVELEDKVVYLEKQLETVSSSALEMHKLLEESLTTQAHSKSAIDEVETLRSLTESQEFQIEDLRREINSIVTENQCLKVDNEMDKSTIKKLEKECSIQIKKNLELSEKNKNLTLQLDKEIENNNTLESNYKSEIYQLRSKLEDVEMNLKRSEFQVKELNCAFVEKQDGKSSQKMQAACDEMQLKIQIGTLEAMNVELSGQLKEEKNARRMLEDHVGDVIKELNNLKKTYEISEKERNDAVTKLQVLTQYFKDKEAQLHKELEAKDKLYSERESKDQSLSQKLASMREEISNLKIQNEELRKEILDQESSFKGQLANAEQKTREHWFALRQAERKYKECEQEAASLRNKVLLLETKLSSQKGDDKNNSGMNGEIPPTLPSMMYPPLSPDLLPYPSPSEFIPPPPSPIPSHSPDFFPPEPLYSPDERLPPLGGRRPPSPPPPIIADDDEYTPPPLLMKYPSGRNRNNEPIPSYSRRTPPPRHRSQFKPRQPRSSIDSPSSGMSLESLDKSGR